MKTKVKFDDVISMLDAGKSRKEIGEHYGLSNADTAALFKDPDLKGRRAKKQRGFVLVKNSEAETTQIEEEAVEIEQVNAPTEEVQETGEAY